MSNKKLIQFIESHGVKVLDDQGEYITLEDVSTLNGKIHVCETSIAANLDAALTFLNY